MDLNNENKQYVFGDNAIRHLVGSYQGGATIDVDGLPGEVLKSGHIVLRKTADGSYKAMPVSGTAFGTKPDGYEYAGVVIQNAPMKQPMVGIMYSGEVNEKLMPYTMSSAVKASLKTAVPTLVFTND